MRLPLFALQLLFHPGAVLVLMLLFGYSFPGNPLLPEDVGPNTYRPSSIGVVVLPLLCVLTSAIWHRRAIGRWFAPEFASGWMLPANLVAAGALWMWVVDGLEGNLMAFLFLPGLGLATWYWVTCLARRDRAVTGGPPPVLRPRRPPP
jgi:hypothetical protein